MKLLSIIVLSLSSTLATSELVRGDDWDTRTSTRYPPRDTPPLDPPQEDLPSGGYSNCATLAKKVKLFGLCVYGNRDEGNSGEHQLHLQDVLLNQGAETFRENDCHHVEFETSIVGSQESLFVGTIYSGDGGDSTVDYTVELYSHEWHDETCGTYYIPVAMDFNDPDRIDACWEHQSGDPPNHLALSDCPDPYRAQDNSVTFFLEVSPSPEQSIVVRVSGNDDDNSDSEMMFLSEAVRTRHGTNGSGGGGGFDCQKYDYPNGWENSQGYTCDDFARDPVDMCRNYGDSFRNHDYVADEACAACGGGSLGCDTRGDWTDSDGNGCRWYAEDPNRNCGLYGSSNRNDGTAEEMCAVCGGGFWYY